MFFQKEIETMKRSELEALQLERLKWTVDYCYKNVPFYTKKLDEAGISADKIKSLSDIKIHTADYKSRFARQLSVRSVRKTDERDGAYSRFVRHNR